MSGKRPFLSPMNNTKRRKCSEPMTYFQITLQECGLILKKHPQKCEAIKDIVYIIRDLKKSLKQHDEYPRNIETFVSDFKTACTDKMTFEYYLLPNIVRKINDKTFPLDNSLIKLLLNVTFLQTKLVSYIFDKVMDELEDQNYGLWVKMTLNSFSKLDTIESSEDLSMKLIDLLDNSSDGSLKLQIISAIPDIIGDREHDNIASELSKTLMNVNLRDLIPAILDCLTNLCLSDSQFEQLQKVTLKLMKPSNAEHFSNFVKFLLTPGRLTDNAYEQTIKDVRQQLSWSQDTCKREILATSQLLTAKEIRNSMLSSKDITKAWLKVISSCKSHTDHKPIDIIFLLIIASLSDEKLKLVEKEIRKLIELRLLKKELLDEAFITFKPILNEHISTLISLANYLLKPGSVPSIEAFGAHMHLKMFFELGEFRKRVISELLQLVFNCKDAALNTLNILNNIGFVHLKHHSRQIVFLLDRLDDVPLERIKAIMNLVCGLAYGVENSSIRDEIHIIIKKQLSSCIPAIKNLGILAGVHAVKYLMNRSDTNVIIGDNVTFNTTLCLPKGDLREAAQLVELLLDSTAQFPDMAVFFCDELAKIIDQAEEINESFLAWLTFATTNYWYENFLVDEIERESIDNITLSMQLCLNDASEVDEIMAVNIGSLALEDNREINVEVLSSLFHLLRVLHYKKGKGDMTEIDALLGLPIVMPSVEIDEIKELSESRQKKVLKCYTLCVNWIRELLNAFVTQKDDVLKPKILGRIATLIELEEKINILNNMEKRHENDDTNISGTAKTLQTQSTQLTKSKQVAINNSQYRPLDFNLIHVIEYNLTPSHMSDTEMTYEMLTFILSYLNIHLEKVLIGKIKKKTGLNKDIVPIYNYEKAEKYAHIMEEKILPKLMEHLDSIISFLDGHVVQNQSLNLESLNASHIKQSLLCLDQIYELLTIYFRWIEFKDINNVSLLKTSLQIVAKEDSGTVFLEALLTAVAKAFQKHEIYMITISSATSLIQFLKALQELSTGKEVRAIVKDVALKFLSKQWKTEDHQILKGLNYTEYLENLIKIYLSIFEMADFKQMITSLIDDVANLLQKTDVLQSFPSISKRDLDILLRNYAASLLNKIKSHISGGLTNEELIEMWETVAYILKCMTDIVNPVKIKQSVQILKIFMSKGFPILKIEFQDKRQRILDMLNYFKKSIERLEAEVINSQSADKSSKSKKPVTGKRFKDKAPEIVELSANFSKKASDLLKANDCSDALEINVRHIRSSTKKPRKNNRQTFDVDETLEDNDEDFLEDDENLLDDIGLESAGISEMT